MKTLTHENNFIIATWNVRESTSENVNGKITMSLKPEFYEKLKEYKKEVETAFNGGKEVFANTDEVFWTWNIYGAGNRVESEIIELIEREFKDFSNETEWLEIISKQHEVNGYSISFNDSWKEFQTYHPEIGSTEGFQSYKEAVAYCEKG